MGVLLTQCPSPSNPFHSITDLLSVHLLLIHSFSLLFVEREWYYLYVICFVPTVCSMKVLVIWQFLSSSRRWWSCVEMGRRGIIAVILPLSISWLFGGVGLCTSLFSLFFSPPIQSSIEVYWGFYRSKILYISVLLFYFVDHDDVCLVTRECLRRKEKERISIDFVLFLYWLMMVGSVAWLHVVSVHPIIYDQCLLFFVSWHSVRMLLQFYSFAHFFSLFYSFAFDVFDKWRVECRLSLWMSLLIFPFY